jgi:mutator protein MutT
MTVESSHPVRIAIAVVEQDGRFLIGRRPSDTVLAGLWEFPGGKINPGETPQAAAARECLEETGLAVDVIGQYEQVDYHYDHGQVNLHFFRCVPQDPRQAPDSRFRWVLAGELVNYEFPAANAGLLAQLASGSAIAQ